MARRRVLVCGSNYGRAYISAIGARPEEYELAGILARGSPRSYELAARHGVPLYRDTAELPEAIDMACAAMSGTACEVVLALLRRGTHVLCEHPQQPDFLEQALALADRSGVCFHVNGHFAYLEAVRAFIGSARELRAKGEARFADMAVTDRSLYSALDILRHILPAFEPTHARCLDRTPPFSIVRGELAGVPVTLQVQESLAGRMLLPDGSREYLVDHRITLGFPPDRLSLLSYAGPVIWNSHDYWQAVYVDPENDMRVDRTAANLSAMAALLRQARDGVAPDDQTPEHILDVSRAWRTFSAALRDAGA